MIYMLTQSLIYAMLSVDCWLTQDSQPASVLLCGEGRPALRHLADVLPRAGPAGLTDHQPVQAALEDPGLGEGDAVPAWGEGQHPVLGEAGHDPVALAGVEIPLDGVYVFPRGDCVQACQYHLRPRLDNIWIQQYKINNRKHC